MTHRHGLTAIADALNRVQTLSSKHSEQAKMIDLGATAWAFGVTPEMMHVFARIASSLRVTKEDIRQLERRGIDNRITPKTVTCEISVDTGPFEEALKRYVEEFQQKTRPWLDAKPGEIWALTGAGGLEQPWRRMDNGTWVSCTSNPQRYSAEQAIAGRRIWPEPEAEEPTETAVAYARAYRALQELFVAVNTKKDDGK